MSSRPANPRLPAPPPRVARAWSWLAGDLDRYASATEGGITELTAVVAPPAIRHITRGETTGVLPPGAQHGDGEPARHGQRRKAVSRGAGAQLTGAVTPPAIREAAGGDP